MGIGVTSSAHSGSSTDERRLSTMEDGTSWAQTGIGAVMLKLAWNAGLLGRETGSWFYGSATVWDMVTATREGRLGVADSHSVHGRKPICGHDVLTYVTLLRSIGMNISIRSRAGWRQNQKYDMLEYRERVQLTGRQVARRTGRTDTRRQRGSASVGSSGRSCSSYHWQ